MKFHHSDFVIAQDERVARFILEHLAEPEIPKMAWEN
jgi:hypothetical protein